MFGLPVNGDDMSSRLINFSSVEHETKVKLFSFSFFSLLTHFYCSTHAGLGSLANDFRQRKKPVSDDSRVPIYLIASRNPFIHQIYDREF